MVDQLVVVQGKHDEKRTRGSAELGLGGHDVPAEEDEEQTDHEDP